jgi:hypothetical protein
MDSLPFDWQARRLVETNLNYFILNLLCFPPNESRVEEIAGRAARLSCPDDRFAEFAKEAGVKHGPLLSSDRQRLRAEIDALVAHAYGLSADDLRFVFEDFTMGAVPPTHRSLVIECFEELA